MIACVCMHRATREALERLEATVARQDAELAELRVHVDALSAPWVTRLLRATWQLFLGPCSSSSKSSLSTAAEGAASSSNAGGAMHKGVADKGGAEAMAALGRGNAIAQEDLGEPLLSGSEGESCSSERAAGLQPAIT